MNYQDREKLEEQCHVFHPYENPVFLPGDKVYDKRDYSKRVFRIKARIARWNDEIMLFEAVETKLQNWCLASTIIPFLVMVNKYKIQK